MSELFDDEKLQPNATINAEEESFKKTVVKQKRIIRNPQYKLNSTTLKNDKGLPVLTDFFNHVQLKGSHHEEEDLNTILSVYEHWAHRLYPKLPFKECIAKIEQLGRKKEIKTYVKRLRMGEENEMEPTNEVAEEEIDDETMERILRNKEKAQAIRLTRLNQTEL